MPRLAVPRTHRLDSRRIGRAGTHRSKRTELRRIADVGRHVVIVGYEGQPQ